MLEPNQPISKQTNAVTIAKKGIIIEIELPNKEKQSIERGAAKYKIITQINHIHLLWRTTA